MSTLLPSIAPAAYILVDSNSKERQLNTEHQDAEQPEPLWQPLPPNERRVLGVLVEKAKTTPSGYPLTLNSLRTGCNQKSNRDPIMDLDADDVEDTLEKLRELKAISEVHGDGRTVKYRHYMKDWLAVDGTELAVMAELLLRGAQTVGELRGRAARMCKGQLPDMGSLRPVLQALVEKKLVVELSPAGRGQTVTHGLYSDSELERVKRDFAKSGGGSVADTVASSRSSSAAAPASSATSSSPPSSADSSDEIAQLKEEVRQLRNDVEEIRSALDQIMN